MCVKSCFLVPADETDFQSLTFEKCARKHCIEEEVSGYWFSPECVKENRDAIVECCKKNCIPKADIDCDTTCEWEADVTIHPGEAATADDGDLTDEANVFLPTPERHWIDERNSIGMLNSKAVTKAAREVREEAPHNKSLKSLLIGIGIAVGVIAMFLAATWIWRRLRKS